MSKNIVFLSEKETESLLNPKISSGLSRVKHKTLKLPKELLSVHFNDIELDDGVILERIKKALDLLKMQESNAHDI